MIGMKGVQSMTLSQSSPNELEQGLVGERQNIPQALLGPHMSSMRWRRQACICANGGPNAILTAKICLGCNQRDAPTHPA